ncbi:MAG: hypothetical protein ABR542_02660 [Desulfonatronovibrio sp.]|nr:hypothetical protein [Desulfovibrionales bacterium]
MDEQKHDNKSPRVEPDFFPPGSKVCFLCLSNENTIKPLQSIFKNQGFLTSKTEDIPTAVQKLRLNQYQCIVTQDGAEFKDILTEISSWPGNVRRDVNLILMGDQKPSFHQQKAFTSGVNFYLNINDMNRMDELIRQVIGTYDEHYQPWNQAREVLDAD